MVTCDNAPLGKGVNARQIELNHSIFHIGGVELRAKPEVRVLPEAGLGWNAPIHVVWLHHQKLKVLSGLAEARVARLHPAIALVPDDLRWIGSASLHDYSHRLEHPCDEVGAVGLLSLVVRPFLVDDKAVVSRFVCGHATQVSRRGPAPDIAHRIRHARSVFAGAPGYRLFPMIDTILRRRSLRGDYDQRTVPRDVIDQIVGCGCAAPSSKNAQPWRIHVVTDRRVLGELADAVQTGKDADRYVPFDPVTGEPHPEWPSTVAESAEVLRSVPLGLFIENRGEFSHGRQRVAHTPDDLREEALVGYGFEMIGIGAAIQSMWLAASELGLGGVFMGDVQIAEDAIRRRLRMRGDAVGVLALGYTTMAPHPKQLEADRVVHHDPGPEQPT